MVTMCTTLSINGPGSFKTCETLIPITDASPRRRDSPYTPTILTSDYLPEQRYPECPEYYCIAIQGEIVGSRGGFCKCYCILKCNCLEHWAAFFLWKVGKCHTTQRWRFGIAQLI
jgi:hypothetical protein